MQRTFKVMGLGGSEKNECRERRGPRIEPWTTTTGRSLGVEKKPEMEKNRSAVVWCLRVQMKKMFRERKVQLCKC